MEPKSWKNAGVVGAAVVAIGCGGIWVLGDSEEVTQVAATPRLVKTLADTTVPIVKPLPTANVTANPQPKPDPPPHHPEDTGKRKGHRVRDDVIAKSKTQPAA